ncbi:MAG: sensor domain-containing diguanylate cyclase [Myxococcota bacterium]
MAQRLLASPVKSPQTRQVRPAEYAFRVLVDLTQSLTEQKLELDAALQIVTNAARDLFEGQHASVRIVDDEGDLLLSMARSGRGVGRSPVAFRRGEGVMGWVIEQETLARIDDVSTDPRFKRIVAQGYEICSMLAIPLWSAGRVIGCLCVTSGQTGHFSEEDETVGRLLANCAVPPLERARLQHLAATDGLTGALNRAQLDVILARETKTAAERGAPLAILSMDLDHFKVVNDDYGHAAGDQVLRVFAQRVRGAIRTEDIFIRRGGEEFVVVLPGCDLDSGQRAAQRIRKQMAQEPVVIDGVSIIQRVSVGVAVWNGSETPEDFDKRADEALYDAKRRGRNRISVAP